MLMGSYFAKRAIAVVLRRTTTRLSVAALLPQKPRDNYQRADSCWLFGFTKGHNRPLMRSVFQGVAVHRYEIEQQFEIRAYWRQLVKQIEITDLSVFSESNNLWRPNNS